ncbi:MAG: ATP-binding protein [Balneolaceae bacterium]
MALSYTLSLISEFTEVEKVPDFVERISRDSGMNNDLKGRVMLSLSEAVTNAIVHGNQENAEKKVDVTVQIGKPSVIIYVRDEGNGFEPGDIPDPIKEENLLSTGGRGLFLIEKYCDEVEYQDGGSLVVMKFHRS